MSKFEQIKAIDDKYFMNTYSPYEIALVRGDECTLYDSEGRSYTDFLGGIAVNALGYNNPIIKRAVKKQLDKVILVSNYFYSEPRGLLAEQLVKGTHFNKVFLSNSGAEANECAIKLTRKYMKVNGMADKFKIVTALNSFHGRTLATVTATGQAKYNEPFAPLPEGFTYVPFNDIDALKKALSEDGVAAFMIECIQGEGGVLPATVEYMKAAREITKKNKQLLIIDEIQTGGSRTGTFYAYKQYNIKPDIVTLAKAIGGGLPISATVATDKVASAFNKGDHGTTYGANPLTCSVALAVVKKLKSKAMLDYVKETGEYFMEKLENFRKYAFVKDIRGKGLMIGVEFDKQITVKDIVIKMLDKGYILNACGNNVLRFIPPLIIKKSDIDNMLEALDAVMREMR
ncbi:MAG: aspartate aminotransferase family protein [Christensenellales bacterium]|jgi:acetylornithine/N-succinyldiaminopimelate aminotransferase